MPISVLFKPIKSKISSDLKGVSYYEMKYANFITAKTESLQKIQKIQITKVPFESIDNTHQKCQEIFSEDVIVVISTHINNLFE